MAGMSKWVQGTVTGNVRWTDRLHSLQVEAPEVTFVAGQFGRLALPAPPGSKEEMLGRPYSFVNAPGSAPHEFYFVTCRRGPLSPRLAALAPGEPVWLLRNANGFFCVGEVPDADVLWCLATGTGLGPFLSILRTPEPWAKFAPDRAGACGPARERACLPRRDRRRSRPPIRPRSRTFRW